MRRTYGTTSKRISINLSPEGEKQFDLIVEQLTDHYEFRSTPSLSLILQVAIARLVDNDPASMDRLAKELAEMARTKKDI